MSTLKVNNIEPLDSGSGWNFNLTNGTLTVNSVVLQASPEDEPIILDKSSSFASPNSGSFNGDVIVRSGSIDINSGSLTLRSGSIVADGNLTIGTGGLNAQSSSLTSSATFTAGGGVGGTQTSGSAGVTGSSSVTGSSTVTGTSTVTGSSTTVGTSTTVGSSVTTGTSVTSGSSVVIGDSLMSGDVNLNGCLTINCCSGSLYEGFIGIVVELICTVETMTVTGFVVQLANGYGDVTNIVSDAASAGDDTLAFYTPRGEEQTTYTVSGSDFVNTPDASNGTYITATTTGSGSISPNIVVGSTIIVGQPGYVISTVTLKYPLYSVEGCVPVAEFCCDGVTISSDLTVDGDSEFNGDIEVNGDSEFNGDVDINGCLTISCPTTGSEAAPVESGNPRAAVEGQGATSGSAGAEVVPVAEFCCDGVTISTDLTVDGDSEFNGDVEINGCLTINCCEPLYTGFIGQSLFGSKSGSINYEIIALTESYGNVTPFLDDAAAVGNGFITLYSPEFNQYASYGYEGSNYNGTRTFLTASGTNIPNGTILYIGQPGYQFQIEERAGDLYTVPGECTPVAEFCCDGITLHSDTVISGSLDVTGPTNLHGGLIVTGCIEMLCPGEEATSYYGYGGQIRDGKETEEDSGIYQSYGQLSPTYGDVTFYLSESAAENGGNLQVLNTITGVTQPFQYVSSVYTGTLTRVILEGDSIQFNPPTNVVIGNLDSLLLGADILMGTGSATTTSVATFCCDGINLNTDVTIPTGSLTLTGSLDVTGSVTVTGCVEIITSASCDQVLFTGFNAQFRSSFLSIDNIWLTSIYVTTPPYGNIVADFESYVNANQGVVTFYNSETQQVTYANYTSGYYNNYANVFQFTGNSEVVPDSNGLIGVGVPGTSPLGADLTVTVPGECTSTVVICDDEVVVGTDVSVSGSVSVTGSVVVGADPCAPILGFGAFVKSCQELQNGVFTSQVIFSPQYGNIETTIEQSAANNGNKLRLVNSDLSFNILCNLLSYDPTGVGSIFVTTNSPIPILQPIIVADAAFISFASPADAPFVNTELCPGIYNVAVIDANGSELNSDLSLYRSLMVGSNNESFGSTSRDVEEVSFIGYRGTVTATEKGAEVYLDEEYGNVGGSLQNVALLKFYVDQTKQTYVDSFLATFFTVRTGEQTVILPQLVDLSPFIGQRVVVGVSGAVLVGADEPVIESTVQSAIIVGKNNLNEYEGTLLAGEGLTSYGGYTTVLGKYNAAPNPTGSILVVGNGNESTAANAFEVSNNGSIIIPTTSSAMPSYQGSQGEMFFGDDGLGNYVIWAYLGGAWRSGSLS